MHQVGLEGRVGADRESLPQFGMRAGMGQGPDRPNGTEEEEEDGPCL